MLLVLNAVCGWADDEVRLFNCDKKALETYRRSFFTTAEVCVKGRFEQSRGKMIGVIYHEDHFSDTSSPLAVEVKEDGTFERWFTVHHPVRNDIRFDSHAIPFYVEPGHTVNLFIRRDGRVEYTDENGKEAPCAAYLTSCLDEVGHYGYDSFANDVKTMGFREFGCKMDSIAAKVDEQLSRVAIRSGFSTLDYVMARNEKLLRLANTMLDFQLEKSERAREQWFATGIPVDSALKAELADVANYRVLRFLPADDPMLLAFANYSVIQNRYTHSPIVRDRSTYQNDDFVGYENEPPARDSLLAVIDREIFGGQSLSMLAKIHLLNIFATRDVKRSVSVSPDYSEEQRRQCLAQKEAELQETMARMKNMLGCEALAGHLERIYQRYIATKDNVYALPLSEATIALRRITDQFCGKYVFIDFWSTGCGPCRQGIERTKEVREAMRDNPEVAFVFITNEEESPKAKYDDYVAKHLVGEHTYRVSAADYIRLRELFQFNGIPHYEVLDKEGNVVRGDFRYYDISTFNQQMKKIKSLAE